MQSALQSYKMYTVLFFFYKKNWPLFIHWFIKRGVRIVQVQNVDITYVETLDKVHWSKDTILYLKQNKDWGLNWGN